MKLNKEKFDLARAEPAKEQKNLKRQEFHAVHYVA